MPATFFEMLHLFSEPETTDSGSGTQGAQITDTGLPSAPYDRGTAQHSSRVGQAAALVASRLGLDSHGVDVVAWAGMLHDIGKLTVAHAILYKPGPLTESEWDEIRRHPENGAAMVLGISAELAPIADGIRSHHERWDGGGYPDGLAGAKIPLAGRIVAVVDVFDSLTSDRPYRIRGWSEDAVVEHIRTSAGTHFDPAVVATFLEVHEVGNAARRAG